MSSVGGTAQKGSRVYLSVARGFQICPRSPPPVKAGQRLLIYLTQEPWCGAHPKHLFPCVLQVPAAPHPHVCTLALHPLHPSGAERAEGTPGVRRLASLPHPLITSMRWPRAWCRSPVTDFCSCSEGWKLRSHFTDEETKAQWGAGQGPTQPFGP